MGHQDLLNLQDQAIGLFVESQGGPEFLKHLKNRYYWNRTTLGADGDAMKMSYREGQRSVVMGIIQLIETDRRHLKQMIKDQENLT